MKSVSRTLFLVTLACVCGLGWATSTHAFGGFVENRGQVDSWVKYYAPGSRAGVYFTQNAVVIDLKDEVKDLEGRGPHRMPYEETTSHDADSAVQRGCAVYIRFEGASPSPVVEARGELETKYNYFLGNDPTRWRTEVPAYAEVVYRDVWPGVDLVFGEDAGRIAYRVIVAPGADRGSVRLGYEGADRVTRRPDAALLIETAVGSLLEVKAEPGKREGVLGWLEGGNALAGGGALSGRLDNPSSLLWSTFLGGGDSEWGCSLVLDASGNAVVTGGIGSSDFPTTPGAYDTTYHGYEDIFVAKLSGSGSSLLWSTFLGGTSSDEGCSLVLDASGNAVVTGHTYSSDFPTTSEAYDTTYNGYEDVFVAKLSGSGSLLLWSTFLGGSSPEWGNSLVLDASGDALVTGGTVFQEMVPSDFPMASGAHDTSRSGGSEVFVAKLSSSGSSLLWSTFLGGSSSDEGCSLVLDASGNAIVTGWTQSSDFLTTPGAYDTTYNGGEQDVFVAKLSSSGSPLLWSTLLGGSGGDEGRSLVLDASGNTIVAGYTRSSDFPATPGAYDTSYNGGDCDVFLASLSGSGSAIVWSTFLGGGSWDDGCSLVLDASGNAVVTGYTYSSDFPTTPGAYDTSYNGSDCDVFVAKLLGSGSSLLWSTFLGGSDWGNSLVLDASGNAVVTGGTGASGFPTTPGVYDTSHNGGCDVFVAKLDFADPSSVKPEDAGLGSAKLYPNFPDPFRASTIVQFYLPERQQVSIATYDVQGRVVRTLVDGITEPGMQQMQWDGKSGNETEVAPGIYFVRMEAGSYRATTKVVLLR